VTQPDGFQVIVLRSGGSGSGSGGGEGDQSGGGTRTAALILNRGMPNVDIRDASQSAEFVVPRDAFAHGRPDATVALQASMANGATLPTWVEFDPLTGKFKVNPPANFKGVIELKVTAVDNQGVQVESKFSIKVGAGKEPLSLKLKGKPSLTRQLADAGKAMRLEEQDMALKRLRSGGLHMAAFSAPLRESKV
jgi:hypothetical protein